MSLPEDSLGMSGPGYATKRQMNDPTTANTAVPRPAGKRVNLLNWDGSGLPEGLFPQRAEGSA